MMFFTEFRNGAPTAPGTDRFAQRLTECHEDVIDRDPPFGRKFLPQGHLRMIRCLRLNVTETVADTVDVRIHADTGFAVTQCQDKVRRFPAHAWKFQECIQIVRYFPSVSGEQNAAHFQQVLCLPLIESHRIEEDRVCVLR